MIAHRDKTKTRWRWFVGIALAALRLRDQSRAFLTGGRTGLRRSALSANRCQHVSIQHRPEGHRHHGHRHAVVRLGSGADFFGPVPRISSHRPAGRRRLLTKASTTALPSSGSTALVRYSRVRRYSVLSSTSLPRRQVCRQLARVSRRCHRHFVYLCRRALERRGSPVQHRSHESSLAESVCVPGRG